MIWRRDRFRSACPPAGQVAAGCPTRRSLNRAADQIRAGHQSEDRQSCRGENHRMIGADARERVSGPDGILGRDRWWRDVTYVAHRALLLTSLLSRPVATLTVFISTFLRAPSTIRVASGRHRSRAFVL